MKKIILFAMGLAAAGLSCAEVSYVATSSGNWGDTNIWNLAANPSDEPGDAKVTTASDITVTITNAETAWQVILGDGSLKANGTLTLDGATASLTTSISGTLGLGVGYSRSGALNVLNGASVSTYRLVYATAYQGVDRTCAVTMDNGTITTTENFLMKGDTATTSTLVMTGNSVINVGGTFSMSGAAATAGACSIESGSAIYIAGDVTATIQGYIDSGYIIASSGGLSVTYDSDLNKTVVTSVPEVSYVATSSGNWGDTNIWSTGANPSDYAGAKVTTASDITVTVTSAETALQVVLGDGSIKANGTLTLDGAAASVTTSISGNLGLGVGYSRSGALNVLNGASVTTYRLVFATASQGVDRTCAVTMDNGTINTTENFLMQGDAPTTSTLVMTGNSVINVGGTFTMQSAAATNGTCIIEPGSMINIAGDVTAKIQGYIDSGYIIATSGSPFAAYDSDLDQTVVYSELTTIGDVTMDAAGGSPIVLSWQGTVAASYAVQMREDLVSGSWSNIVEDISGINGIMSATNNVTLPQAFYRVIAE
jgi:hypothetical protein